MLTALQHESNRDSGGDAGGSTASIIVGGQRNRPRVRNDLQLGKRCEEFFRRTERTLAMSLKQGMPRIDVRMTAPFAAAQLTSL